ncbi:MAG: hypothetical protein GY756_22825, partial [bacterium]|nr:hypothetical protein [bacterium]
SDDDQEIIYNQGRLSLINQRSSTKDIDAVKKECNKQTIHHDNFYSIYKALGINYGIGHKTVQEIYIGDSQVLTKLELPKEIADNHSDYYLHPGIMDGALQAVISLFNNEKERANKVGLPFTLDSIEIFGRCNEKMWSITKYSNTKNNESVLKKVDIDLYDEQGKLKIKINGYASGVIEKNLTKTT